MVNDNIIGIFYIATGIYKEYFPKFLETIHYCFPNKIKKLIVISDGLKEYDNNYINGVNIVVEDFISYPYPFININKLQIIYHYASKYNISNIVYFDSETYFIKKDEKFYNDLLQISKEKFISLITTFFINHNLRDHIYGMNSYTDFGEPNGFDDFKFFYNKNYQDNLSNYKWIQTSFFMCSINVLKKIYIIVKDLIAYNSRVMGCKLNYSDEFYINYLNLYYPELFHCDMYAINDNYDLLDIMFFHHKYKTYTEKNKYKFGNLNFSFRMFLFNNNDDNEINKFFITHRNNFLLCSCNSHTISDKIFFDTINLDDVWFDDKHNIILEKGFYSNTFIRTYDFNICGNNFYIGFINKINDFSNNFDYDDFYYNDYDYIEGYSFDDIKNMKFKDIDMCCFSKRYIEAYFNNNLTFKPKKYKV